jgi:YD repeat-containing protein
VPFASSVQTRARFNLLVNDAVNHVKRVEVIRPRGNAVVFEFAWDAQRSTFSPIGTPAGWGDRDGQRQYVLRDLTPSDDADLTFALKFDSGVTHTFGGGTGGLLSISDDNFPSVVWTSPIQPPASPKWSGGTIGSVEYSVGSGQTITTTLGYESGGGTARRVTSLAKTHSGAPVPEFSYTLNGTTIERDGVQLERVGSIASGSGTVSLETRIPGVTGSHTVTGVFEDGLLRSQTVQLEAEETTTATTTFDYTSGGQDRYAGSGGLKRGKLAGVTYPDSSWETFEYDPITGWLSKHASPWGDSTPGGNGRVEEYGYDASLAGGGEFADPTRFVERPRSVTSTIQGTFVGATMSRYENGAVVSRHALAKPTGSSAKWDEMGLEERSIPAGYGSYTRTTLQGTVTVTDTPLSSSIVAKSLGGKVISESSAKFNRFGQLTNSKASALGASTTTTDPAASGGTDTFGRALRLTTTGNLTTQYADYSWYGPASVTDVDGSETRFTYTPLGQVETATSYGVETRYAYDAAGNVVFVERLGSDDGGTRTTASFEYDVQGRLRSSTDELERTTTYDYSSDGRTLTTTYADGTTSIQQWRLDGTPVSVSGSAVFPVDYEYAVDSATGDVSATTKTNGGANRSVSYTNVLGQTYKSTQTSTGTAIATSQTDFDKNGRPGQSTGFDGALSFTQYDPMNGLPSAATVDADGSGRPSRRDRRTVGGVTSVVGATQWDGVRSVTFDTTGVTVVTTEEANGGLNSRSIVNGLTSTTDVAYPGGAPGAKLVTTTAPDGTKTVDTYTEGLLHKVEKLGTDGTLVWSRTFDYDPLRRMTSVTDPVFGTTTDTLRADGSVESTELPDGRTIGVTTFDQKTGAPEAVLRPDGTTVQTPVGDRGESQGSSGAGSIPFRTTISNLTGQLTGIQTFRSGTYSSTGAGADTTTFDYYPATGLLKSKAFADGRQDEYGYNDLAQLKTITRPGVNAVLDYNGLGELSKTTYRNTGSTDPVLVHEVQRRTATGSPMIWTQQAGNATPVTGVALQDSLGRPTVDLSTDMKGASVRHEYYGSTETANGAAPGALKLTKYVASSGSEY